MSGAPDLYRLPDGFSCGPVEVALTSTVERRPGKWDIVITIRTNHQTLDIYCTPGGRFLTAYQRTDDGHSTKLVPRDDR